MVGALLPSPPSITMSLLSLPFDVLLAILRNIDNVDVVRTGIVSPLMTVVSRRNLSTYS